MRISGIAILAAVAFLSSADGMTTKMATPNLPAMARSLTTVQHNVASKRMLRFASPDEDDEDDEEEEERGITAKLKGLAESVAMHSELKDWLKKGETVDKVLENLKLTTGVGSILENPAFKHLDDYISMYKEKFPHSGVTMVGTLTKRYDDGAVARALEAGKWSENKATNELAKKLQGEQFRLWLEKEQSPLAIFKLLGLNSEATHPLQGYTFKAWQSYLAVFNKRLDGKENRRAGGVKRGLHGPWPGKSAADVERDSRNPE